MYTRWHAGVMLLIVTLTPFPVAADLIDFSDKKADVLAAFQSQSSPRTSVSDSKSAPLGTFTSAEVLLRASGIGFPNLPNQVGGAFASSAADTNGFFATGVNGFFFQNSDPANQLNAQASVSQVITNNTAVPVGFSADISIPAPTLRFFGIGNSVPSNGVAPNRLGEAQARLVLITELIHPDGSRESDAPLVYGLSSFRIPLTGALVAAADTPGDAVTRFDEPDGSFGFRLPDRVENNFHIADLGPGDTLSYAYTAAAFASTGFGETGVFAGVGDPFHLESNAGSIKFHLSDANGPVIPPSPVPEPATLAMIGFGFIVLGSISVRRVGRKSRS